MAINQSSGGALRKRRQWTDRILAGLFSVGIHGTILAAFFISHDKTPPVPYDDQPIVVAMVVAPPKEAPAAAKAPVVKPKPKPKPPLPKAKTRPVEVKKPPPEIIVAGEKTPTPVKSVELSEAAEAGARTAGAGSGDGGRNCDMVRYLQAALRKDRRAQQVVAEQHHGKAIMVWDGDWLVHPGQEGKGLAGLREVMLVEIGFAPEACKQEPVRGLVVISLNDSPGAPRIAFGQGAWKWSDMLFAH